MSFLLKKDAQRIVKRRHFCYFEEALRGTNTPSSGSTLGSTSSNKTGGSLLRFREATESSMTRTSLLVSQHLRMIRSFSSTTCCHDVVVDLRSDTVTQPSRDMLESCLIAKTGDDVMGEDPTVLELQEFIAHKCGKDDALFVPTGTMSNLVALMAHCHERASEIIVGSNSHICLYEGGNVSGLAGIHSKQLVEDSMTGQMSIEQLQDALRMDNDDHYPKTQVICLEHTHNILGGIVLNQSYIDDIGQLCHGKNPLKSHLNLHIDGARFFHAVASYADAKQQQKQQENQSPSSKVATIDYAKEMLTHVDSISLCLSKGLGAPLGSVLVGNHEFIRLAKRARKRCGGGMRQVGVVASMGLYALQHNVNRLIEDNKRAKRLAYELKEANCGIELMRHCQVDSNLVFFSLPTTCSLSQEEFVTKLQTNYNVLLGGGYTTTTTTHTSSATKQKYFRAAVHMDIDDEGIDRAAEAITTLCRL